jgi:hypothetical protein
MRLARNSFADLESLVFTSDRNNYYSFVSYCRDGGTPHAGVAYRQQPYDLVAGPVSLGMGQSLVISQADQVSFHTVDATAAIKSLSVHAIGTPSFDVSQ